MANPTSAIPGDRDRHSRSPTGVLQYRDLDVLLALVHQWCAKGQDPEGKVSCELHDLMRWMGYSNDQTSAPYVEIRASVQRLRYCRVMVYKRDEIDDVRENRQAYDFTLLADLSSTKQALPGDASLLTARMSSSVLEWMHKGSQSIDLDVYAYLVRHQFTRRLPLARVLWVALTRWRQLDGSVRFRPGWLADRYADVRNQSPEFQGQKIFMDAFNERSRMQRALTALAKTGVLGLRTTDDGWCEGRFVCPTGVQRLRDAPVQRRLFKIDTMAIAEAAARGDPEPTPHLIEHTRPGVETREMLAKPDLVVIEDDQPEAETPPPPLTACLRACPVSSTLIAAARSRGWDDAALARVLLIALYGHYAGQTVEKPVSWAAKILLYGVAAEWTREILAAQGHDLDAIRAWAYGPGGPLADKTKAPRP